MLSGSYWNILPFYLPILPTAKARPLYLPVPVQILTLCTGSSMILFICEVTFSTEEETDLFLPTTYPGSITTRQNQVSPMASLVQTLHSPLDSSQLQDEAHWAVSPLKERLFFKERAMARSFCFSLSSTHVHGCLFPSPHSESKLINRLWRFGLVFSALFDDQIMSLCGQH